MAVSVALHGALLWMQSPAGRLDADAPSPLKSGPLQIRVVAAANPVDFAPVAADKGGHVTSATRPEPGIVPGAATSVEAAPISAPEAVPLVRDAPLDDAVPADAAAGYLPRYALTRAPRPLSDPVVSVASGLGHAGEQRGVFSLFINASGVVDSVVRDGPTLSASLEEAAVDVLRATRFSPGEVDGIAVAALMRIEIVFENHAPVAPTAPVIVSQQPL